MEKEFLYIVKDFHKQNFEGNNLLKVFFYGRIPLKFDIAKWDKFVWSWHGKNFSSSSQTVQNPKAQKVQQGKNVPWSIMYTNV